MLPPASSAATSVVRPEPISIHQAKPKQAGLGWLPALQQLANSAITGY